MRAIVILALVGSAFAVPRADHRIVGGSATTVEQYPYMANMQYGFFANDFYLVCGGSLITENSILSAGHCYDSWPMHWYRACLGSSYRSVCFQLHNFADIIFHPQYNRQTLDNDVVIMRLQNHAVLSDRVKLASIAGPNYILPDGTAVTALGWGRLEYQGPHPEQLQYVVINTINQQLCTERYAYLKTQPGHERLPDVTEGMMCAGILDVGGKDACTGDSGGPLVHGNNVIVGTSSWSHQCAHSIYPGVFARVSQYSDWIVSNT